MKSLYVIYTGWNTIIVKDCDEQIVSEKTCQREAKLSQGRSNSQVENKLSTPWIKKTNRQTIVHKTQHTKQKTEQHKPHQKLGVIKVVI